MKLLRAFLDNDAKNQISSLEEDVRMYKTISDEKSKTIDKLKAIIDSLEYKIADLERQLSYWPSGNYDSDASNVYSEISNSSNDSLESDAITSNKRKKHGNLDELRARQLSQDAKGQDLDCCVRTDTIFYNKKIVITGVFCQYPDRNELAYILKSYGADIKSSISGRTNIVIMGSDAGPKKQEKIIEINSNGGNIQVLNEFELYRILDEILKGCPDKREGCPDKREGCPDKSSFGHPL
ncbi:MAG: BRCT domain-containing protein [Candidatus Cryptobacteroides sp.]